MLHISLHISLFLLLLHLILNSDSLILTVDLSNNDNIQSVISRASSGDTVQLLPNTYSGPGNCNINILVSDLSLVGVNGPQSTIIDCTSAATRCLSIHASGVIISGIQFKGGLAIPPNANSVSGQMQLNKKERNLHWQDPMRMLPRKKFHAVKVVVTQTYIHPNGEMTSTSKIVIRERKTSGNSQKDALRFQIPRQATTTTINNMNMNAMGGCVLVSSSSSSSSSSNSNSNAISSVSFSDVVISGGMTQAAGGGLAIIGITNVNILRTSITDNSIVFNDNSNSNNNNNNFTLIGGGAYFSNCSSVSLINVTVLRNQITFQSSNPNLSTLFAKGGGLVLAFCSNVSISGGNTLFQGNIISSSISSSSCYTEVFGSGLFLVGSDIFTISASSLQAYNNSIFVNGGSGYIGGAGIFLSNCLNASISSPIFIVSSNNLSSTTGIQECHGAGLVLVSSSSITISSPILAQYNILASTVASTTDAALFGAGIYITDCTDVIFQNQITVRSNQIFGQSVSICGGGIYVYNTINIQFLSSVTAAQNTLHYFGPGNSIAAGLYFYTVTHIVFSSALSAVNNKILTSGSGNSAGGGCYFISCQDIYLYGVVTSNSNGIVSQGSGYLRGGGLYFSRSINVNVLGSYTSISNNYLISTGTGSLGGSGMFTSNTQNFTASGPCDVANNSLLSYGPSQSGALNGAGIYFTSSQNIFVQKMNIISNWMTKALDTSKSTTSTPATSSSVVLSADSCNILTPVISVQGILKTNVPYKPNTNCVWSFFPPNALLTALQTYVMQLTIDVEWEQVCSFDWIAVYDGDSTASPIIGRYCGTFPSGKYTCSQGSCPPPNNIVSTGGQVTVQFLSDGATQATGFSLQWTMGFPNTSSRTGSPAGSDSVTSLPAASGGGIYSLASTVSIDSSYIGYNRVNYFLLAMGGGIMATSARSMTITNSIIEGNSVSGPVGAGGGATFTSGTLSTLNNVVVMGNIAAGNGGCFWFMSSVQCPASFGGGIFLSNAPLTMRKTTIQNSTALCGYLTQSSTTKLVPPPCAANGGAIAVTNLGNAIMTNSVINNSICYCDAAQGCVLCSGGGTYGDSGKLSLVATSIENSGIIGTGGGGAVYASGNSDISISNAVLSDNFAGHGAGLWLTDSAKVSLDASNFTNNRAMFAAGGLVATYSTILTIQKCNWIQNSAPQFAAMMAFSPLTAARYSISNSFFITDPGTTSILLGHLNYSISTNTWNCSWPGTVFRQELTDEYYSLTCVSCEPGTYSVGYASTILLSRKCLVCPSGAICAGGSSGSDGLKALGGFWGNVDVNGTAVFYPCPTGYCCSISQAQGCVYNHCQGGRQSRLCGRCPPNQSLQFFSESCRSNDECNDAPWAAAVIAVLSLSMVIFLLFSSQHETTGMASVMLYFFQSLPLVKNTPWTHSVSSVIIVVQSIFQLSPTSGDSDSSSSSSSDKGVCLVPNMTASRKFGARILFQGVVILAFVFVFLMHWLLHHHVFRALGFNLKPPKRPQYLAAVVRFLTIAYTSLTLTPLQMLQCVWVDGQFVWWFDASIYCYERWQMAGFVALAILSPLPLIVTFIIQRWPPWQLAISPWEQCISRVLTSSFRPKKRWWLGVSLYRRLLLVLSLTTITDGNWRAITITVLCACFLMLQLIMKPFRSGLTHRAEICCLTALLFLSVLSSPQAAHLQFGSSAILAGSSEMELLQIIIVFVVIAVFAVYLTFQFSVSLAKTTPNRNFSRRILQVYNKYMAFEELNFNLALMKSVEKTQHSRRKSVSFGVAMDLGLEQQREETEEVQYC